MAITILSVFSEVDNVEYRCEKTEDIHGDTYSIWVSETGEELDHNVAMDLYKRQSERKAKQELINRLFKS